MRKSTTITVLSILGSIILIFSIWSLINNYMNKGPKLDLSTINSYEDCALAGFPILESFPEQCQIPDGRTFVNTSSEHASSSIEVTGTFICLPPKDSSAPHHDMCTFGIETDDGDYYGLREPEDRAVGLWQLRDDDKIMVLGVYSPGVDIMHDSLGTIEVDELRVLSTIEGDETGSFISYKVPIIDQGQYYSVRDFKLVHIKSQAKDYNSISDMLLDSSLNAEVLAEVDSIKDDLEKLEIAGIDYYLLKKDEGAAGSVITSYDYFSLLDGKLLKTSFVVQKPRCENYDEEARELCMDSQSELSTDKLIDATMASVLIK